MRGATRHAVQTMSARGRDSCLPVNQGGGACVCETQARWGGMQPAISGLPVVVVAAAVDTPSKV